MIKCTAMRLNGGRWDGHSRLCVSETATPWFSWQITSNDCQETQTAFQIKISKGEYIVFDSGRIESADQKYKCPIELPSEEWLTVDLFIYGDKSSDAVAFSKKLIVSGIDEKYMTWISQPIPSVQEAFSFAKDFQIDKDLAEAILYVCGIGYHNIEINGRKIDGVKLDPAFSDFTKTCYYVMFPNAKEFFHWGINRVQITVGQGWRKNKGIYYDEKSIGRGIPFMGELALSAYIKLQYKNGETKFLSTDDTWSVSSTKTVSTHLFDGEIYDNNQHSGIIGNAKSADSPGGKLRLMTVEPIVEKEIYKPISIYRIKNKKYILDFGQNIAGVCRIKLSGLEKGAKIVLSHAEEIRADGELFTDILRGAKAQDTYIASGEETENDIWQPEFVYHGFRYVSVEGFDFVDEDTVTAVALRTDLKETGSFVCGNGILNQIHKTVVSTEKANMHSILTDCPQRDERMQWLNDATVRFNEMPYNFDIGRIFPKVIQDIIDCQGEDGSITDTAPLIYGHRPADPVCASFLVAGMSALMYCDNCVLIEKVFSNYEKWQNCLTEIAEDNVIPYSHWGDWAGPIFSCVNGEFDIDAVQSANIPGEFISTGFYYYNARLLKQFAEYLNLHDKVSFYANQMENVKETVLKRWWNDETAEIVNGSQACQSFALWLGIIPENKKQQAADVIHNDLVKNDYRTSTGNLCTRYLLDALSENGYADDAYRIMTNEEYPSIGYMLQHAATTVWERFELKENRAMNSHNHPMYGSVDYWFYAYLAGIKVVEPGWKRVKIKPVFPQKLSYVNCTIDTAKGKLSVRWNKQYGKLTLLVNVPLGMEADVEFDSEIKRVHVGLNEFSKTMVTSDQQYFDIAKKYKQ